MTTNRTEPICRRISSTEENQREVRACSLPPERAAAFRASPSLRAARFSPTPTRCQRSVWCIRLLLDGKGISFPIRPPVKCRAKLFYSTYTIKICLGGDRDRTDAARVRSARRSKRLKTERAKTRAHQGAEQTPAEDRAAKTRATDLLRQRDCGGREGL